MPEAIKTLTAVADLDSPDRTAWRDLGSLWIEAINCRFQEGSGRISVLGQLASKAVVELIERLDDVVPLLFSHTAYNSYPGAFIERRRWDRMNLWFSRRRIGARPALVGRPGRIDRGEGGAEGIYPYLEAKTMAFEPAPAAAR